MGDYQKYNCVNEFCSNKWISETDVYRCIIDDCGGKFCKKCQHKVVEFVR